MENTNLGDLHRAVAPKLPYEPCPRVRTVREPRRRPRWLGGGSL